MVVGPIQPFIHPSTLVFILQDIEYNIRVRNWAYNGNQNSIACKVSGELNDAAGFEHTVVKFEKAGHVSWLEYGGLKYQAQMLKGFPESSQVRHSKVIPWPPMNTVDQPPGLDEGFQEQSSYIAIIVILLSQISEAVQLVDKISSITLTLLPFY